MTTRKTLIARLRKAAKRHGMRFVSVRQGGRHEIFQLDDLMIPIPRHQTIDDDLANIIYREAESKLGKGWYRR